MYAASERLMVDQLIAHVGNIEANRRESPGSTSQNRILAASIAIGQACIKLNRPSARRRDYPLLMAGPKKALELLNRDRKISPQQRHQARMLKLGALLIENRNFPTEVHNVQVRMQYETALQLAGTMAAMKRLKGKRGEAQRGGLVGQLTELTCVGLLNKGLPLDHFGVFAPPHQDQQRDRRKNRDVIFCQTKLGEEITQSLQTKKRCQSFCGEKGYDERWMYSPDIALISGHCDLGLEVSPSTKYVDFMVPKLIVKNTLAPENMWAREQRTLGDYSEQLVHTIVTESSTTRAGTAK